MAYTREIRELVLRDLKLGLSAGKISRTYQISIPTIYNWKNKYLKNSSLIEETESMEEDKTVESTLELVDENMKETDENQASVSPESKPMTVREALKEIFYLIQEESLEEALDICNHPLYKDDADILFQKVNILISLAMKDNDIEKAKEACSVCNHPNLDKDKRMIGRIRKILSNFPVLKKEVFPILKMSLEEIITIPLPEIYNHLRQLNGAGCLEEVLNICNNFPDQNSFEIMEQKARALFFLGRKNGDIEKIKESYVLCQRFKDITNFQYLIKTIEKEFLDIDFSPYQSQDEETNIRKLPSHDEFKRMSITEANKQLRLLISDKQLEEAIDIIDDLPYGNNPNIVIQKVRALFFLGRKNEDIEKIKEAYRICLEFKNNQAFQQYIQKIQNEFPETDWSRCQPLPEVDRSCQPIVKDVNHLLMKIYCDFITISEIENAEIDAWYKDLLILAFNHKKSRKNALSLVKKLKEKYCKEEERVRILNKLLERIKIKKGINFDINDYISYLPASFNFELLNQLLQEKALRERKEEEEKTSFVQNLQVIEPIVNATKVCKKPEKRMIVVEGTPVTARYQQLSSSTKEETLKKSKNLKIKDVFESEVFQIGKQLYIQMRDPRNVKSGCEAWDKLEALKEKNADDLEALGRMISLIDRINRKESDFIKTNDQRNEQLYAEAKEREKQKIKNRLK